VLADRPEPRDADTLSGDSSRHRTIVLLGIDGAGKTTTATTLVASLRNSGARAQLLRNPAGRRWMTKVAARFGTALTPAWANRLESVVRCVNVLLAHSRAAGFHGTTVMDRHVACQLVLRSVRGLPQGVVLPWILARLPRPDAIVLIDVPADVAYSRILRRGEDSETMAYLSSSREAYLEIALARGWHIVDGSGTPQQVAAGAMRAVTRTA
jgi:dTMP kinase